MKALLAIAWSVAWTACSAPATMSELRVAEKRGDAGDIDGAIAAYKIAQDKCKKLKPPRRAKATCADALLGEGEVLERGNRVRQAIDVYLAIPPRLVDDPATAAIATYRAGELLLKEAKAAGAAQVRGTAQGNDDEKAAWTALWRVVTEWPDEGPAADALSTLVADGRGRDARALAEVLQRLLTSLAETGVADNLVWWLADLEEHELANLQAARAFYDRIPNDFPDSGLRDDARWHAARLSRELGDARGAVARLRGLLATREVAFGAGSYFSIWLDDAQLLVGVVLRDDLKDYPAAVAAFKQLPELYPASILKDDALYELAVTEEQAGHHDLACAALDKLAKLDGESKYIARGKEICP